MSKTAKVFSMKGVQERMGGDPDVHSLKENLHDGLEIIIHQDHVCCLFANICASLTHCNSNVCSLQSDCIIDSISCHGHNRPVLLQRLGARGEMWEGGVLIKMLLPHR